MMDQFRLYRYKGMSGTAALHIFHNRDPKMCKRKLAINQVGVKWQGHKNKHFIGLVQAMGIVFVDHFYSLHILFSISPYAIIERLVGPVV